MPDSSPLIGQIISHYRIVEKLGAGGMGEVYRARDEHLKRDVAFKVLPADFQGSADAKEKLLSEARSASALTNPNICVIHEVGEAGGLHFIVMELVEGRALNTLISPPGLRPELVVRYGTQIAAALAYAHDHGIIHRDIKSANIVITNSGQVKVLDFGLAKLYGDREFEEATLSTQRAIDASAIVGTLPYIAPEVLRGEGASPCSDIWSLGITLYEMSAGSRPFCGETTFELTSKILREPPPPLSAQLPPGLRTIIERCLEKEPGHRFQRAGEVRAALEAVQSQSGSSSSAVPASALPEGSIRRSVWIPGVIALTALVAALFAIALVRKPARIQTRGPHPIAVLPLQNASAAKDLDFLRLGLADDIATTLSFYPSLSIRPFAATSKYAGPDVDLQKAARELRVADLVTGHFLVVGENVEVTLEAVDVADNRVLWRVTLRGTTRDLTRVQEEIAARVQHGLIPALGVNTGTNTSSNTSHNAQAYELYLRAMSHNDSPNSQGSSFSSGNKTAIQLLERAVALDPGYASAWAALGHFYYYESGLENGGEIARSRAKAALQRAVALDPTRIEAASDLINMESEEGDLNQAYDDIANLLRQRPDSGAVHLVHSYVLWYAGLLGEAESECEKTRSLDAGTQDLASCGHVFIALGKYDRAREYFHLVSGTEYEKSGQVEILLREGKGEEALKNLKSLPPTDVYGLLLEPCLQHQPPPDGGVGAQKMRSIVMGDYDPGIKYGLAAVDSLCGHPEFAFRELRRAIEQDYCAYPQMETDPLLAKIRAMPEFAEIRSLGIACQQHFLEHRKQRGSE
jgi:TolB-like protein